MNSFWYEIELPKIRDCRGNLSFIESNVHVPFKINRVYYLYDVPGGEERGGHAHIELQQFIIALSGSFNLHLNNGFDTQCYNLNSASKGVYMSSGVWRTITEFSTGAICLVLASDLYRESDYIRNYDDFLNYVKE